MKNISVVLFVILLMQGCKGSSADPAPLSPVDEMKGVLTSGTWKVQTVTVDGVDKTGTYAGLSLIFSSTGYTSNNGHVIWPASGTWQFTDNTGKTFSRDDSVIVTIGDATTSKLVLSLTWNKTTLGNGRTESIKGNHVFTFGK